MQPGGVSAFENVGLGREVTLSDRIVEALTIANDLRRTLQDILPLRPMNPESSISGPPESARELLAQLTHILRESQDSALEVQRSVGGRI